MPGIATVAAAAPTAAHAHLVNSGVGPFYDGVLHLFLTPEDLLPVVAVTLLAGLRGPRIGRSVLLALPLGWVTGGAVAVALGTLPVPASLVAAISILFGGLVAADIRLPAAPVVGMAVVLGLLCGASNGSELVAAPTRGVVPAAMVVSGVVGSLFLVVAVLAGQVASLRAAWARVAVRVAGSWIAAIGLLMLGWTARPVPSAAAPEPGGGLERSVRAGASIPSAATARPAPLGALVPFSQRVPPGHGSSSGSVTGHG